MLATGIRTDVGIKFMDKFRYYKCAFAKKKKAIEGTEGVKDLFAEPITGEYIDIIAKRDVIGRYGLTVDDEQRC
jgi:Cu(I)/Ag(I) efflux system membrane protein CusA/SilA